MHEPRRRGELLLRAGGKRRLHFLLCLQEGTVTVAAGGADGALHFFAFALGAPGAAAATLLLQRREALPIGQGGSPAPPPVEHDSMSYSHRSSPLVSVALHHEAADIVAAGDEAGRASVVSLGLAGGGGDESGRSRLLWSAAAPAGVPVLAAQVGVVTGGDVRPLQPPLPPPLLPQWWPHAASTLALAVGASVVVADVRTPPPSGGRLLSLPRFSTSSAGGARGVPPCVTSLAFEAAPCAQPW